MYLCQSDKWHNVLDMGSDLMYIVRVVKGTTLMRKIEQQMINAINNNIDWSSSNTSVHFDPETSVSIVRLHGNKIAEVNDNSLTLFDGGYQSTTTKSRLNAILSEFGYTCGTKREYVFQKQFEWFITMWDNATDSIVTQEFNSGMILEG